MAKDQSDFAWQVGGTLTEVRHIPSLKKNLISLGVLVAKEYSFTDFDEILRVFQGNKEML